MKQSSRNLLLQIITGLMILTLMIWQAKRPRSVELDSGYRQTMGTFARLLVVAPDREAAENSLDAAFAVFDRVEALMSDYDPDSQISRVNRDAYHEPVAVDGQVFEVLSAALEYSRLTDGAFDITVGPVVQLWRDARQGGQAPTPEAIARARENVGYRYLELDPETQTVRFGRDGMLLDVGGIAKGYALDRAAEAMRQAGALGAMIDIGGDIVCFGQAVGGRDHWLIGLQDPDEDGNLLLRLKIDDRAVATSGDYRRFVVVDDRKHSHIINPATAEATGALASVTIIAATAMHADALATAASVMGPERALTLIESIDHTEAILIPGDRPQDILKTSGAADTIE